MIKKLLNAQTRVHLIDFANQNLASFLKNINVLIYSEMN